jgi:lipoprotein-anchoring transpeptidase ErfK/SrfK
MTRVLTLAGTAVLAVATLGGLGAAVAAPSPAAPTTAFPKAGVILWQKVAAHSRPTRTSSALKVFTQFRSDFRPTTLLVLGEREGAKEDRWLKISVPGRPNGRTGWVPAAAVETRPVRRSIVIDLSARTLRVREGSRVRLRTRVAIGRPGMETPTGDYYITAVFRPKERFLGAFAFETSAYSKLSEWPGGGVVGLHGTSAPSLLGKAVSHGCVRMSNPAARALKRLAPAGTPVMIVA